MKNKPLVWHFIYWLLPTLCIASVFIARAISPEVSYAWIVSPHGFLENGPTIFLIAAVVYMVQAFRKPGVWEDYSIRGWMLLFILAAVYFSGEDLNWGQYWFNWDVPQYFLENNKEQETNLHNMSTWFNQKPRLVMLVWALVACALVPLGWEWPKQKLSRIVPDVLWPKTRDFLFVVIVAGLFQAAENYEQAVLKDNLFGDIRFSELQELLLAYLMMLYALHLRDRLPLKKSEKKKAAAMRAEPKAEEAASTNVKKPAAKRKTTAKKTAVRKAAPKKPAQ